jgi:hypothetical protein
MLPLSTAVLHVQSGAMAPLRTHIVLVPLEVQFSYCLRNLQHQGSG